MSKQTLLTQGANWVDLAQLGTAPAAPAAGTNRLYVDNAGLLRLTSPSGGAASRRITTDWGAGSNPPTGAARGDIYSYTPTGGTVANLLVHDGTRWRFVGDRGIVASSAERDSVSIPYDGLRLFVASANLSGAGTGGGEWLYSTAGPGWLPLSWTQGGSLDGTSLTYSYALTNAYATLPGASFTLAVPTGRELEVEFRARVVNPNPADTRMTILVPGVAQYDTQQIALAGTQPILMHAVIPGNGTTLTVNVQGWNAAAAAANILASGLAANGPLLRYRVI